MKKLMITALLLGASMTTTMNAQTTNEKMTAMPPVENLQLTQEWDKVFPKSDKVDHKKVTFINRYGITLAADMYTPKNATGKLAAIAVSGPFGAVKEQSSGLYAQTLAEHGFLTIAFDPSFTGESGGQPRNVASPDINTEDFPQRLISSPYSPMLTVIVSASLASADGAESHSMMQPWILV